MEGFLDGSRSLVIAMMFSLVEFGPNDRHKEVMPMWGRQSAFYHGQMRLTCI